MKPLYVILALLCCISFNAHAQTVLVNPAAEGGFESGTTFAANGWTTVNPATVGNVWYAGATAGTFAGARCAYITNTAAGAYTYTIGNSRTAHLYRDLVIPAGSVNITLSFQWKGSGEIGADRLLVYTGTTATTLVANAPVSPATAITGATLVWTQPSLSTAYSLVTIALPASLAGTTVRLIFTWQNNAGLGTTPGAAVDNISFKYDCAAPAAIAGATAVCAGSTVTLTDASSPGTWSSGTPSVATVSATGIVSGVAQGTTIITYTTSCVSPATKIVSVTGIPVAFTGPSTVCIGNTMTLGETITGGTWSSSPSTNASVSGGVVSGLMVGTANISYTTGCGTPVWKTVTVSPSPAAISGPAYVCAGGATIAVSDATTGGTWAISPAAYASVTPGAGTSATVTGNAAGTATLTYTSSIGCTVTAAITVKPLPAPISGIVPLCTGATIPLSDAVTGGTWASSISGIASVDVFTGIVTAVTGGTTHITYTTACGITSAILTVSPIPGPITGHDTVCVGAHTTLANATTGGAWSSSNIAVATVLTGSGLITGVEIGTTYITYTMPGGCFVTDLLTAYLQPSSISGSTPICPGSIITLSNSLGGGTWSSGNPAAATIGSASGVVTGVSGDTARMVYTTPNGCTATTIVTVNPAPHRIIADSILCSADVDTLTALTGGGAWSSLTPGIATIDPASGILTAVSGGTANIKYTLPTGCAVNKLFTINPMPNPSVTFNTLDNTFYASFFNNYQWYNTVQGLIPGATYDHTAGQWDGNYYVVVTDGNGCTGRSALVHYDQSMYVAPDAQKSLLRVYPNPSTGIVNIECSSAVNVLITSIDGRKVMEQKNALKIDINSLATGTYILGVYNDAGVLLAAKELIKK